MTIYLKATLTTGETITGEFDKLAHVQRYVARVFAGVAPFNAWHTVATVHPVSGEASKQRVRVMVNGRSIDSIQRVNADGSEFAETASGEAGLYTAPAENTPEGAVAGVTYPVRREADTLFRYVVLKVAEGDQPEKRLYFDSAPADGDEDREGASIATEGEGEEDARF